MIMIITIYILYIYNAFHCVFSISNHGYLDDDYFPQSMAFLSKLHVMAIVMAYSILRLIIQFLPSGYLA